VAIGGRTPGLDPGLLDAQSGEAVAEGPAHVVRAVVGQRPLQPDAEVAVVGGQQIREFSRPLAVVAIAEPAEGIGAGTSETQVAVTDEQQRGA
jgi:hypothetical protein